MKRFFLQLAYDGTNYHGWQVQDNAHTVQAELEEKLGLLLRREIKLTGCGRTDTGVHAREFYAHFESDGLPLEKNDLVYKLNRFLPSDIAVYNLFSVASGFHARYSAVQRTYRYYISRKKNPFNTAYSYYLNAPLDMQEMNRAAADLLMYKDFTSFSKLHTQTATNFCKIVEACWEIRQDGMLVFTISADRFLRNMVRAIVGTLLEIGMKRMDVTSFGKIIESKNRSEAGFSVPAKGLFLEKIIYPEW